MRFEAKHSYFKQLSHSMGNFINLPYSLTIRHQEYQCYLNATSKGLHGSADDIDIGPGNLHAIATTGIFDGILV